MDDDADGDRTRSSMAWTSRPTTIELFPTNEEGGAEEIPASGTEICCPYRRGGGRCWYYCDDYVGGGVGVDDWNDVIIIMMRMSSFELYLLLIDVPFNLSLRPSVRTGLR